MVPEAAVRVLGQPPFHATALTASGALSYVGGNWERDIAFAGYSIPLAVRDARRCARPRRGARRVTPAPPRCVLATRAGWLAGWLPVHTCAT